MKLSSNKEKRIEQIKQAVTPLFKKHGIIKASLFGSVLRDDFDDDKLSDIDFLVEYEQTRELSLMDLSRTVVSLEETLERKVDISRPHSIRKELINYIIPYAHTIYEEGR